MGRTRANASNFCGRTPAIFLYPTIGGLAASLPAKARRLYRLPRGVARYASLHIDRHELLGWLDSDDLVDEPHTSGPAILGCPLIWRQWPVGYDVLTNVAIVVMRLVGLAPASVEQFPRSHHGCFGVSALHPFHERLDGFLGVRACESFQLGGARLSLCVRSYRTPQLC